MMIVYSYLPPLLLLNVVVLGILGLVFKQKWQKAVIITIVTIMALIPFFQGNVNLVRMLNSFIYLLSISTLILLAVALLGQFCTGQCRQQVHMQYAATLVAFTPILLFFYSFSADWVAFYPYTYGYQPRWVMVGLSVYALILLACSGRFMLFNVITVSGFASYYTGLLGLNLWNYLIDPALIILALLLYGYWGVRYLLMPLLLQQRRE